MKLRKLKKTRTWYASKMSKTHIREFLYSNMFISQGSKSEQITVYFPKL